MFGTKTLEYFYDDGRHVVFDKYTIDTTGNNIINKKTNKDLSYRLSNGYYVVAVYDNNGKKWLISVARAVASTFFGNPPTLQHTADHIIREQKLNNDVSNIQWSCKIGQNNNRTMPDTYKSSFIITKDNLEMTSNEWVKYLKDINNPFGNKYNSNMINKYAQKRQHGFLFKEYPDIEGEVWKRVKYSENTRRCWEISNKSRVKYVAKYACNVLSGERLGMMNGYPIINIYGKHKLCHILAFEAFYPDVPRGDLLVLHKHDDKTNFNPENLRLGTRSENGKDAHNNDKYIGTKSSRIKCASYIGGILEKEHDSQEDAAKYLYIKGHEKVRSSSISLALSGNRKSAYGRTWKLL